MMFASVPKRRIWVMAVTIMLCSKVAALAAVDRARDQVAADDVERGGPAADADAVALAQRLEVVVVADGVVVVLGEMALEVDPQAAHVQAVELAVLARGLVADVAGREVALGARRLAVRQPAAAAERALLVAAARAALEADEIAHASLPTFPARARTPWAIASAASIRKRQYSGV